MQRLFLKLTLNDMTIRKLRVPVIVALFLFNACAMQKTGGLIQNQPQRQVLLFSAERAIQDEWQQLPIRGETEYRVTASAGRVAIRAIGQRSASGLMRRVQVNPLNCPQIEWSWRVDQLQETADIRVKEKEDRRRINFPFVWRSGVITNSETGAGAPLRLDEPASGC